MLPVTLFTVVLLRCNPVLLGDSSFCFPMARQSGALGSLVDKQVMSGFTPHGMKGITKCRLHDFRVAGALGNAATEE